MSGAAFPAKGSIGPATQTVWFSPIVDRLNMLLPYNNPTAFATDVIPAHYGNLQTPFHGSFGAFTTAPDGTTNTAQLFVEDTSNNIHFIQGGTSAWAGIPYAGATLGPIRVAGIFKASGRRIGYKIITTSDGSSLAASCTVVFDLVGGQVGVAASIVNNGGFGGNSSYMSALNTQIYPAGQGFYYCIQDVYVKDGAGQVLFVNTFLDQGTGTGALNNSYIGDGASGVYCWRTNMMPVAAYGISTQTYISDFLSLSEIDTTNSLLPGFKWYTKGNWVNYINSDAHNNPLPAGQISVASSILTLTPPGSGGAIGIGSAAQVNAAAGTFVGQGFGAGKPTLYELKASWNYTSAFPADSNTLTFWGSGLEWIVSQGQGITSTTLDHSRELDFMEGSGTGEFANPDTDALAYVGVSGGSITPVGGSSTHATFNNVALGFPAWQSGFSYNTNSDWVLSGGVVYVSTGNTPNLNQMPPNATYWTALSYPSAQLPQPVKSVDYTQMHVYSMLVIPFWGQPGLSGPMAQQQTSSGSSTMTGVVPDTAVGLKMSFFDGAMSCLSLVWGPNVFNDPSKTSINSYLFNSDNQNLGIWLNAGSASTFQIDYFKVMQ